MKIWLKRITLSILLLLVVGTVAFVAWSLNPLEAMPEALTALESDDEVLVTDTDWMVFTPTTGESDTGVIIYPGGHVDPRAYAPLAKEIAREGYLVILPPMPLNLAFTGINVADEIMQASPEIEHWYVGGHSLGGAMAAEYAADNAEKIDGLFLWASYSAESTDLSLIPGLKVLSIYGTEDGGAEEIRLSRERSPEDIAWMEMDGANHAQFGWYGIQPGDGIATISRIEQQARILKETLVFIEK
ncbi:MAG: alpha/beta hydrolase [Anaerolineae bacterium]|jgi:dienelactone hydrolase|nr:alpha/beta hydrolase [Anaerolineae bacterium]MBT7989211.1 alpha/beta hydrolase [Anaerolineae bacterium]